MSKKKQMIDSYFNSNVTPVIPRSKATLDNGDLNKTQINKSKDQQVYSRYKIFDSPDINSLNVIEIDPNEIINWEFHDRPASELGDIESLAKDLINLGQQQPCIVRENKEKNCYELIIGERRWRAAKHANIKLKVIVTDYDNKKAALAQATENDQRKDISDYAKGMSFANQIERGIIKQKDLIETLGKSKQYVSALLSFSKIPNCIIESIGDMSNVSSRTAEKIKQLSAKGDDYISAIMQQASNIQSGSIGEKKLTELVLNSLTKIKNHQKEPFKKSLKKILINNKHVVTIKQDKHGTINFVVPKAYAGHLHMKNINLQDIGEEFAKMLIEYCE